MMLVSDDPQDKFPVFPASCLPQGIKRVQLGLYYLPRANYTLLRSVDSQRPGTEVEQIFNT